MNVLIIDEISMVGGEYFDELERMAKKLRGNNKPWGGIQILVCGVCLIRVLHNTDNFTGFSSIIAGVVGEVKSSCSNKSRSSRRKQNFLYH